MIPQVTSDGTETPAENPSTPTETNPELEGAKKEEGARAIAEEGRNARRRVLGCMEFVGQLCNNGLLTERIVHNCVTQLLLVNSV